MNKSSNFVNHLQNETSQNQGALPIKSIMRWIFYNHSMISHAIACKALHLAVVGVVLKLDQRIEEVYQ
jgi:hypothetical protein